MAFQKHIIPFIAFTTFFIYAHIASTRNVSVSVKLDAMTNTTINGTTILGDCWSAMNTVKSCSNEIASYLKNGTIDIGPSCCQAIKTLTHDCWPNLLTTLGITVEQTNVLRGYCDAARPSSSSTIHAFRDFPKADLANNVN